MEQGDIAAIRPIIGFVGTREIKPYVWLLLHGLDDQLMTELSAKWFDEYDMDGAPVPGAALLAQRRYCIPLDRLQAVVPTFAPDQAADPREIYQPFLPVDPDSAIRLGAGIYLRHGKLLLETVPTALPVQGLVFDKSRGSYL
jgi:hypothetical protein